MHQSTLSRSISPLASESGDHVLGQYIPLLYHYNMLQDDDRVIAFRDAINYLVAPGMRVLELGGGTGILSSFAARCGAQVVCVERNPELVNFAEKLILQNGLEDQIEVIQMDASEYVPDEPVDVVVCEMLHVGLLREQQAQVIAGFKKRYRQKHGPKLPVFIPEASILMAQPVHQSFDFAGYHAPVPMFQAPLIEQSRTTEIAPLSAYATITYDGLIPMQFKFPEGCEASIDATVNAVRFVTQNILAIDEEQQQAITWPNQCLVLPIESPFEIAANEKLKISFHYSAGGEIAQLAASLKVSMVTCGSM
ncbi:ribosomal protein L11 methyltransferase [Novipirellula aureliae]|uniref:Ribosomal protein L11 methyltransferase n=1 Tax=Novipirellula aureliae TaxID=2527966 RepID=A0A5C6E364_9BACT|nr:methyltransferase domain-containing protein [Novipirellula aureliae]TWU44093.1 ribosomal protein L11 methyltransferase [Novipirellula aureliae]